MSWVRKTGVSLVAGGAVLCAAGVGTAAYGRVMARLEVARFRAQGGAEALWDGQRVQAYERSLRVGFTPSLAVLRVPGVGIEAPVLEGTSDAAMNRGVGHIEGSALPGEDGNVGIAGHRDGFFRALKDVKVGELVELQRKTGAGMERDEYKVEQISVVDPTDVGVLGATKDATLTLVTCYPFYFVGTAPKRFVVQAVRQSVEGRE
jgi:sortase A